MALKAQNAAYLACLRCVAGRLLRLLVLLLILLLMPLLVLLLPLLLLLLLALLLHLLFRWLGMLLLVLWHCAVLLDLGLLSATLLLRNALGLLLCRLGSIMPAASAGGASALSVGGAFALSAVNVIIRRDEPAHAIPPVVPEATAPLASAGDGDVRSVTHGHGVAPSSVRTEGLALSLPVAPVGPLSGNGAGRGAAAAEAVGCAPSAPLAPAVPSRGDVAFAPSHQSRDGFDAHNDAEEHDIGRELQRALGDSELDVRLSSASAALPR